MPALRWPHVYPWRNCNVKMTSPCHIYVTSQHIQDFLEFLFSYFSNIKLEIYLVVSKKKNPLFVWEWDRKIPPSWSPIVITEQASWCQSVILGTDFLSNPHMYTHDGFLFMMDSYFRTFTVLPLNLEYMFLFLTCWKFIQRDRYCCLFRCHYCRAAIISFIFKACTTCFLKFKGWEIKLALFRTAIQRLSN